jgi:S-formylglutathione hydrolase FrmB
MNLNTYEFETNLMKKVIFFLAAIMICGMASAQFAGVMRGQQEEPLPEGFKPSSCNTFLSQYPAVNAQTTGNLIETAFNGVFKDAAAFDKQINLLFISTGIEERSPKDQVESLRTHGIKHIVFHESQGTAHEWLTWRRALNEFAPILFKYK